MFTKLFRRHFQTAQSDVTSLQHQLDLLRYVNADSQMMQLHCDRMQAVLNGR